MTQKAKADAKAEFLFGWYVELGLERSLEKLAERCAAIGLGIHVNTLKNYSAKYEWQQRVAVIDAKARLGADVVRAAALAQRRQEQAALGRELQHIAAGALQALMERGTPLTPSDIARLADVGTKIERLAMGEATSRIDVVENTLRDIIMEIVALFLRVNVYSDQDDRNREFGAGADAIIGRHVPLLEAEVKG